MTARRLWIAAALVIVLAAIALKATTIPVRAHQFPCAATEQALQSIESQHGEVPASIGASGGGKLFVLTVNPETGSWTAFLSPDGQMMCVIATGDGFQPAPDALKSLARPAKGA